jgi:polyhydroxybutyrate depolymerase
VRGLILILLAFLLLPIHAQADALRRVDMPGGRHYLIALPEGVPHPPLVLALHGGGGSPEQFARTSRLTAPALAAGFAIAYPAGTSRGGPLLTWNGLYCCGAAAASGVDDAAFLAAVIDDASRRFGTARRASLTGMSNGAIMAQTFAALRPDRTVALATVAGTMDTRRLVVSRAVPFLHIHGTADTMVPFAGGQGDTSLTRTDFASVESVVSAFLRPHGRLPLTRATIDPVPDGTRVLRSAWGSSAKPEVVLLTVENGAHVWPGGRRARGEGATQDISATEEVIRFLAAWR